jgi:hypothetical protein
MHGVYVFVGGMCVDLEFPSKGMLPIELDLGHSFGFDILHAFGLLLLYSMNW